MSLLLMSKAFSQNIDYLKSLENEINNGKKETVLKKINEIDSTKLPTENKAYLYFLRAKIDERNNIEDRAYANYIKAKKLFREVNNIEEVMKINLNLAYLVKAQKNGDKLNSQKYLDEYLEYAEKSNDLLIRAKAYQELASVKISPEEKDESLYYFRKAAALNKKIKNEELSSSINTNLGALYSVCFNLQDSALFYLEKDLPYLNRKKDYYGLSNNYVNQAAAYYNLGNSKKAIELLTKANELPITTYVNGTKSPIHQFLAINYAELGDYKNAYENFLVHKAYEDTISADEQNVAISEIQTKYQTLEKELDNQALRNKNKTNRTLLYIFIGLLLASLIIGFLIIKNARKKEKISRQEKLIEEQKLEKALKDYELNSIDMMLEGQEKERQRIANDLHDNLGSMLATLKINFEHLKLRKNELRDEETKLYERTDELIEEAYQKVRRLAHAKNAGVFANEGLIPALKKMAEKISIPGKLQIQIVPFGFTERLENTLEIAIFRMVQELATNIIKHSKATEATVQLTHHDDNINIIIEDNGIGFDTTKITEAEGMGLSTMKKKVGQLNGSFTIDSTPGKGTTIIIDLPV